MYAVYIYIYIDGSIPAANPGEAMRVSDLVFKVEWKCKVQLPSNANSAILMLSGEVVTIVPKYRSKSDQNIPRNLRAEPLKEPLYVCAPSVAGVFPVCKSLATRCHILPLTLCWSCPLRGLKLYPGNIEQGH